MFGPLHELFLLVALGQAQAGAIRQNPYLGKKVYSLEDKSRGREAGGKMEGVRLCV